MKMSYQCLKNQKYTIEDFSLVPIRWEDRYEIMQWRNEQIFHLRQEKELIVEDQDAYFENIISTLFDQEQPKQILFSLLKDNRCIGYGGLVHINWIDKNAEISFIMETKLEGNSFDKYWDIFLGLIEKIAFEEIKLHKIYTYAFDLRPNLYKVLKNSNYKEEARLKEHCLFQNNYIDILIHTKTNDRI